MLHERGTEEARNLYTSSTRLVSSRLIVPEAHAALARARRTGRIGRRAAATAIAETEMYLDEVEPIEVDAAIAATAGRLADVYALRAYDAVHLASYQRMEAENSLLVAADGDLVRAATAIGHAVAVPGT